MKKPLLIAGPCVIERTGSWLADVAEEIKEKIPDGYNWVLKSSYWKGNRTSQSSFRGVGLEAGLQALQLARAHLDVEICTDIHSSADIGRVARVVDYLQIPERMSRDTEVLEIAAMSDATNILLKCGVSMSPAKYGAARDKLLPKKVIGCYRGTAFGDELVFDVGRLWRMAAYGHVIADITHATQKLSEEFTKANRGMCVPYARAAVGLGCIEGLFLECHPDPATALSDSTSQLPISEIGHLLGSLKWE